MNRNFYLLWQGLTISALGRDIFGIVAVLWLIEAFDSASIIGVFMLAVTVPFAISTLWGGVLADRYSRKSIIILSDLCNGVWLSIFGIFLFLSHNTYLLAIGFFTTQVLLGTAIGLRTPAVYAFLPDLVSRGRLAFSNALITMSLNTVKMLGKGVGGLLFVTISTPILILLTGISYLSSVLLEFFIKVNQKENPVTHPMRKGICAQVHEGVIYIVKRPDIKKSCLLSASMGFCIGGLLVNIPFIVRHQLSAEPVWYGYMVSALSLGLIIGSSCAGLRFNQLEGLGNRRQQLVISLLIFPILLLSLSIVSNEYIALLVVCLVGISSGICGITIFTLLQFLIPTKVRGRVLSFLMMIDTLVIAIGSFTSGLLIDFLDNNTILVQILLCLSAVILIYPRLANKTLLDFLKTSTLITKSSSIQ